MTAGWKTSPLRSVLLWSRRVLLWIGSTWVGVALLAGMAIYMSLASTVPVPLARALRITLFSLSESVQVELYDNWGFVAACVVLCVNLAVATVVRVRLCWRNAGAWCCHLGLIVLAVGSLWYNYRAVKGDNVTLRDRGAWSPIRHVYREDSHAVYVQRSDAAEPFQTPLKGLIPRGKPRDLLVAIAGGPGVEVRATRFLPSARMVSRWEEASPNRVPAVRLRIADGEETGTLVLSPSLPEHRQFGGSGYVMVYHAGMSKQALAKVIAPADPNQGPRMPHELALILAGPDIDPTLAVVRPDGTRWHGKLQVGKTLAVPLAKRTVRIEPLRFFQRAARVYEVAASHDEPVHPGHEHGPMHPPAPALRVDVTVGAWKRTTYVPFAAYQHLAPPQMMDLPGNRAIWLSFSREQVALPATLNVRRAEYQTYPASGIPKDYRCEVEIVSGGVRRAETLSLNHPVHVGAFQFSQGSWAENPHHPTRIFLTAATRPGLWAIWAGCALICLGMPIAFYVKPLLMKRRSGS